MRLENRVIVANRHDDVAEAEVSEPQKRAAVPKVPGMYDVIIIVKDLGFP